MFALLLAFTLGYHAIDLDTGRTMSMNAEQRFPMGSVFKFPLAIEVLHRVDEKKLDLGEGLPRAGGALTSVSFRA